MNTLKILFVYLVNHVFAVNGTATEQITFDSDSTFLLSELRGLAGLTQGDITLQMNLNGSNVLSNEAFDASFIGSGANENNRYVLSEPMMFPARSQLNVTIVNNSGGALTYELQLWGWKVI